MTGIPRARLQGRGLVGFLGVACYTPNCVIPFQARSLEIARAWVYEKTEIMPML